MIPKSVKLIIQNDSSFISTVDFAQVYYENEEVGLKVAVCWSCAGTKHFHKYVSWAGTNPFTKMSSVGTHPLKQNSTVKPTEEPSVHLSRKTNKETAPMILSLTSSEAGLCSMYNEFKSFIRLDLAWLFKLCHSVHNRNSTWRWRPEKVDFPNIQKHQQLVIYENDGLRRTIFKIFKNINNSLSKKHSQTLTTWMIFVVMLHIFLQ